MKKSILIVMLIILINLTGCNTQKYYGVTNETNSDLFEVKILNAGEKYKLNVDYYNQLFDFTRIKFYLSDENVARVNQKEEVLALRTGKSTIKAVLYNGIDMVQVIDFGMVYIIDTSTFTPITNASDLKNIRENPSGLYYLAKDIEFKHIINPIPFFSGMFINPNNYVIKGLTIKEDNNRQTGLFGEVYGAYINGIILEDVNIIGNLIKQQYPTTGALAGSIRKSYISDIHVTGNIESGYRIGGIVGYMDKSYLVNSSFEGVVANGLSVGGLCGSVTDTTNIINSYVIADLSSDFFDSRENPIVGGLIGHFSVDIVNLKNCYFTGNINVITDGTKSSIIGSISSGVCYIENVYYTLDITKIRTDQSWRIKQNDSYLISVEDLKSGEQLNGLYDFYFQKGYFPIIVINE